MRFKLGLLIGFGLGWLVGKDVLLTFFQGLRKSEGPSSYSAGSGNVSSLTGSTSTTASDSGTNGSSAPKADAAKARPVAG